MRRSLAPGCLCLLLLTACGEPSSPSPVGSTAELERQLMETDRAFAVAAKMRGIDGWVSYFTEDAARVDLTGDVVRGHDEIRVFDAGAFADPAVRLTWEPTDAGVFSDRDHGFTRGRYRIERSGGVEVEVLGRGTYLSIWRFDDGAWKVILDTGTPDSSPE